METIHLLSQVAVILEFLFAIGNDGLMKSLMTLIRGDIINTRMYMFGVILLISGLRHHLMMRDRVMCFGRMG